MMRPVLPTLDARVPALPGLVVMHFRAEGSAASRATAATLDELVRTFRGPVTLIEVDVDRRPGFAGWFNVRSVPTVLFVKDGRVVDRVIGMAPRALLESVLAARAPRTVAA